MTTQDPQPFDQTNAHKKHPVDSGKPPVPHVIEDASKAERPKPKNKGGLPKIVGQIATILVVPVGIAVLGSMINWSIAQYSGRQKSVELAVSILREPLKEEEKKGELLPLREWAVDVVNKLSEVPFSEAAAQLLRTGQRTLPPSVLVYPSVDGQCEVAPETAKVGEVIVFSALGAGGSGLYVFSWLGDEGLTSQNRTVKVRYHTPGQKSATVRITSNGQSVYRTATVEITPADAEPDPP